MPHLKCFTVCVIFAIIFDARKAEKSHNNDTLYDFEPSKGICGSQPTPEYWDSINATVRTEFPWLAYIEYVRDYFLVNIGFPYSPRIGTLINTRYVLTSAGCILRQPYLVRLGGYHVPHNGLKKCMGFTNTLGIDKSIAHPQYGKDSTDYVSYDIGLIRLNESVAYTDYIQPICLPTFETYRPEVGHILLTAGWISHPPTIKRKTYVMFAERKVCDEVFDEYDEYDDFPVKLKEGQICGIPINTKKERLGDGSIIPLMYSDGVQWYQKGVLSTLSYISNINSSLIYTQVAYYADWLRENLEP